jgi:hypothetical protein
MTALLDIEVDIDIDIEVVSDAEVRRTLRAQIARLEADLPPGPGRASSGARILTTEELEIVRDDLVRRTQERRFDGGEQQERKRREREEMALGLRRGSVSNGEVGEPGCTRWQSWFRLTISGGCP